MDKDKIFERIQKQLRDVPLLLVGTGGTIPYGIPGMRKLAEELIGKLGETYAGDKGWTEFAGLISADTDLESALLTVHLSDCIIQDIISVTWKLVNRADIKLMKAWLTAEKRPELGRIVQKFYQTDPQRVNIITTNYDRVIEYACDQCGLPLNTMFKGEYYKRYTDECVPNRRIVNLLKVHGSLDWFYIGQSQTVSIPLQEKIPKNMLPAIVTPGTGKYEKVLEQPFRNVLHIADKFISEATGYLCIGYGFNDNQIQTNIISEIRKGKPITVWTKELSSSAFDLITKSGGNYAIVIADESEPSQTRIIFPEFEETIDDRIWDQEGLLKVL